MQEHHKRLPLRLTSALVLCGLVTACTGGSADPEQPAPMDDSGATQVSTWEVQGKMTLIQVTSATGDDVPVADGTPQEVLQATGPLALRFPNFTEFTFEDVSGWELALTRGTSGAKDKPFLQVKAVRGSEHHNFSDANAGNNELEIDGKLLPGSGFFLSGSGQIYTYPARNVLDDLLDALETPEAKGADGR